MRKKKEVHIVGCGFLGSNVIFELAKLKLFDSINIYDHDKIDEKSDNYFPLSMYKEGYKTDAMKLIMYLHFKDSIEVVAHKRKMTSTSFNKFVIDCRDNKSLDIDPTISLSLDRNYLVIDCTNSAKNVKEFSNYYTKKSFDYIHTAMAQIFKFIKAKKYEGRFIYDLEEV